MVSISRHNRKLGGFIPSVDLPPLKTCHANAPCLVGCYAIKVENMYTNTKNAHERNLKIYTIDPESYFKQVLNYINNGLMYFKYFRWHSSGDIVNKQYFEEIIKIAKKVRHTKFYLPTKKFKIVNDYLDAHNGELPRNLIVAFSAWDKEYTKQIPNPYNLPIAYVRFKKKDNSHIDPKAFQCPGKCEECKKKICWNLKRGQSVVYDEH